MSFIRDFMRMDLDPPPVEKPKRFRYRGELRYPMTNKFDRDVYIKLSEDGRCYCWEAAENEVVRCNDNLYVWTGKEWTDFHPGPCTDYDGPKPGNSYERRYMGKRIYPTSQGILDSSNPFHRMIQEKTDLIMKHLGIGYEYDAPNEIERNGNTVYFKYNLKYIGETDTNVRDNPKGWMVQIIHRTGSTIGRRTISPQIGFVVSYNDVEYVYTGSEKGWVAINDYRKEETAMPVRYERIYPRLAIKKVIFNAPATTVIIPDIGSPLHEAAKKLAEGVNNALSGLKKDSE